MHMISGMVNGVLWHLSVMVEISFLPGEGKWLDTSFFTNNMKHKLK